MKINQMTNKILELAEKRKNQYNLAAQIARNINQLKSMSDEDIQTYNIYEQDPSNNGLDLKILGVSIGELYSFAQKHYEKTEENILDATCNDPDFGEVTLLWSPSSLGNLIKTRKLNEKQYNCLESAVKFFLEESQKRK